MRSNGFGRIEQRIIVNIPWKHAEATAIKLDATLLDANGSDHACLEWVRHSVRTGDDEDIIFHLSMILKDGENRIGWKIDWSASDY